MFVKRAALWVDRVATGAEPASLKFSLNPYLRDLPAFGFDGMSEPQLAWYFTWRDAVRHGAYPPVDDAYVVLLASEIVNGIGVLDAAQGFRALTALDAAYGDSFALGTRFAEVLEDYALVHGLGNDLAAALRDRGLREAGPSYSNNAIQARVEGDLTDMPCGMIAELSGIDLDMATDFQMDNDLALATFVPRALEAIDAEVRRAGKGGVIERLAPKAPTPLERIAFNNMHYVGKRVKVVVPRPPYYRSSDRLSALMKGVMRHTENRLRSAAKLRGRTSAFVLTESHRAVIDEVVRSGLPAFAAEFGGNEGALAFPAPPKVTIDPDRVGRWQSESHVAREMLIDAMAPQEVESPSPSLVQSGSDAGDGNELSGSQRAAVATLLDGGDVEREIRRIAEVMGLLPEVLVDGINEAAIDVFGEAVIDVSGGVPAIFDEYRDDLAAWVGR